ncbi:hypothetical protein [Priestia koreensis]|uniref:hypothetical protein n=1 Tax=Priestia koreensis TaxID=284581 RepID=UPI000AB4D22E|nr:hypothetical protein [Priestia koreensis]MCM3003506.1 hypothetical protein [Priestia koreensis]UNL86295.1 hypothetical protein IE339_07305 [Priestia koreensis]
MDEKVPVHFPKEMLREMERLLQDGETLEKFFEQALNEYMVSRKPINLTQYKKQKESK